MVAAAQTPPVLCASSGAAAARSVHLKEEYVRTRRESLRANAEVSVLNRQLASTRKLATSHIAAAGSQLVQSELAVALLSGELAGADDELALAHRAIRTLSTSRHVLIREVRELRALLAEGGGERHADLVAARDAALESLGAQQGRVRELQLSVTELSEQLRRQQIALKAVRRRARRGRKRRAPSDRARAAQGCELADEAVRVERAHAEELERVQSSHVR